MTTFEDIIQEVYLNMEGFSGDQDIYGTLSANLTNSATTFTVLGATFPDGSGFTAGVIEVGEELIYVQQFDRTTGTFTGALRGWRGTTAVAHSAGTLVRNNPKFARLTVRRAVNDTVTNLHPRVPAIKTYEFTYSGGRVRYDIPADVARVMRVTFSAPGASKVWEPVNRWNFDAAAAASDSTTQRSIEIYDALPGRKVQILYQGEPSKFDLLTDTITDIGLYDWARDLVVLGTCYRLASFVDAGRISGTSVEQNAMAAAGALGGSGLTAGQNLSKYFFALYQTRLLEAEQRIQALYPAVRHYTR
jgi:hypothetical protein